MAEKKVIAVLGATGAQGGGLVRAILNDPSGGFAVRAITRDVNSSKAKALAQAGAEVISASVDDVESLKKAFHRAYGAFCVTFYWEHLSAEKESGHIKDLAEAAQAENLQHVIFSTLEDTRKWVPLSDNRMPTLYGKYKVPHFDSKGSSEHFFTDAGVPTTFLLTSFYWDNFISFGMGPKPGPDGKLALTLPLGNKKLPGIVAEDIGKSAYGIFKKGSEFIGKKVGIAGQHLTGMQIAESFSMALGKEVVYNGVSPEVYRGFGFPGADDLGNMFQFKQDFEDYYCGARSIEFTRLLDPELQTLDQWLANNKAQLAA